MLQSEMYSCSVEGEREVFGIQELGETPRTLRVPIPPHIHTQPAASLSSPFFNTIAY